MNFLKQTRSHVFNRLNTTGCLFCAKPFFCFRYRAMAKILEAEEARHNDNTSVKMTTSSGHEDEMRPIPRRLGELLERNELVLDTLFSSIGMKVLPDWLFSTFHFFLLPGPSLG